MDTNNMRNTVILKNLPSNLIEEAFVVLKKNQRIKKFEYVDNQKENFCFEKNQDEDNEFVIKEAELLISNYIEKIENQDMCGNKANLEFEKKYKKWKSYIDSVRNGNVAYEEIVETLKEEKGITFDWIDE